MDYKIMRKEAFVIIGKEGSTNEGEGFIQRLWEEANSKFHEVEPKAKKDEKGNVLGIWGAMSDFSRTFQPWEGEFSKGLYLAGVECLEDVQAPVGWVKWVVPAYEYLYTENEDKDTFIQGIQYLRENKMSLEGAVQEFTCPQTGKGYLFYPIKKL